MNSKKGDAVWFQKTLLTWSRQHDRPMPWKAIKDPYLIWISEIILQQTRVNQGWEYYLRFKETFPTINDLADASEQEVLKLWQGLGYYSRARNLHSTAKNIVGQGGKFKADYDWLLSLKGVGPYTAAAIASFAFNLPYAVLDGNVFRLLSRIFAIDISIDSSEGKKHFQNLALKLLDKKKPGVFNQAIIDFGASICKPRNPLCDQCPFSKNCLALKNDIINNLPVKEKKLIKKNRFFYYLEFNFQGKSLFRKRNQNDIWRGLYDFPIIESEKKLSIAELKNTSQWKDWNKLLTFEKNILSSPSFKHQLTHQTISGHVLSINCSQKGRKLPTEYLWVGPRKKLTLPFPKIISLYLQNKHLSLISEEQI